MVIWTRNSDPKPQTFFENRKLFDIPQTFFPKNTSIQPKWKISMTTVTLLDQSKVCEYFWTDRAGFWRNIWVSNICIKSLDIRLGARRPKKCIIWVPTQKTRLGAKRPEKKRVCSCIFLLGEGLTKFEVLKKSLRFFGLQKKVWGFRDEKSLRFQNAMNHPGSEFWNSISRPFAASKMDEIR